MNAALAEASHYHDPGAIGYFAVRAYGSQTLHGMAELPRVLNILPVPPDLQISQAAYRSPRNRRTANVLRIGLNFVDCDIQYCRYDDLAPEQLAYTLLMFCDDVGVPRPNLINFSGRGLHCKWLLDTPIPAAALSRWGFVQKALATLLADFGADRGALDAARCLRASGTLNIKSGETARTLWDDGGRWDFDLLCAEVLPYTREQVEAYKRKQAEKRQAKANTTRAAREMPLNLWSIPDLWCRRLEDIRALLELRGWSTGVPEGSRNYVLYVATICIYWAHRPANLEAEAQELARQLCPSLSAAQVRSCVCSVVARAYAGNPYKLKTQNILDLLKIRQHEQRQLQTLYNLDERKRRKQEYDKGRQWGAVNRETYEQQALQRREQARTLRAEGLTYGKIAAQMGLTAKQVDNLLNRRQPSHS